MTLKELRKVYEGQIMVFDYAEKPVYETETGNKYCDRKYDIDYLDKQEILSMHISDNILKVKILA